MYFDTLYHENNQIHFKNYDFSPDKARIIVLDLPVLRDEKLKAHISSRVRALEDYIDFCSVTPEVHLEAKLLDSSNRPSLAKILQIFPKEGSSINSIVLNDRALFSGSLNGIVFSSKGVIFDSPAYGKYEIFFNPLPKEEQGKKA